MELLQNDLVATKAAPMASDRCERSAYFALYSTQTVTTLAHMSKLIPKTSWGRKSAQGSHPWVATAMPNENSTAALW